MYFALLSKSFCCKGIKCFPKVPTLHVPDADYRGIIGFIFQ